MFLSYKAEVDNQLDRKIKRIRYDKGGEYITLNDYCENEGIIHEVTPPYSFESNGVAGRKNKTFKEMMNCKTRENSNFLKKGKMVISVKIRNFSRSRMMKHSLPLESSCKI